MAERPFAEDQSDYENSQTKQRKVSIDKKSIKTNKSKCSSASKYSKNKLKSKQTTLNTTFSFDAGSESQRKIYNPASKSCKKNKNAVKNYSINEATNYNGNILSQLKRTNDEFIQYIEGNNTINSSYDENEELDKCDSLNQGPNSAICSIERKKNIDITEIEPHYILNTYNSNDENMPIMYKKNQTNINVK